MHLFPWVATSLAKRRTIQELGWYATSETINSNGDALESPAAIRDAHTMYDLEKLEIPGEISKKLEREKFVGTLQHP